MIVLYSMDKMLCGVALTVLGFATSVYVTLFYGTYTTLFAII